MGHLHAPDGNIGSIWQITGLELLSTHLLHQGRWSWTVINGLTWPEKVHLQVSLLPW